MFGKKQGGAWGEITAYAEELADTHIPLRDLNDCFIDWPMFLDMRSMAYETLMDIHGLPLTFIGNG